MLWGSLALGLLNAYMGFKGLSEAKKTPTPKYTETPEMQQARLRAEAAAKTGYSSAEKAAFEQRLNRSQNTAFQRAVDRAPGLAQTILSGITYSDTQAQNEFAARDSMIRRENIRYADSFARYLQELNNRNIQEQIRQKELAVRSYGAAAQSGLSQLASVANYPAKMALALEGGGGKKKGAASGQDDFDFNSIFSDSDDVSNVNYMNNTYYR